MERKFLKEIELKEMVFYLLQRWWIILGICILAGIGMLGRLEIQRRSLPKEVDSTSQQQYVLVDGNYVYATLINICAEPTTEIVSITSYLGLIISNSSISAVIERLDLQESYIDIFNKMSWEVGGENIKLKISSPLPDLEGHSWEEILNTVVEEGTKTIQEYYENVKEIRVIDEPYIENALLKAPSETVQKPGISIKHIILAAFIGGVLSCAGLLLIFLLQGNIVHENEIEKNLDIPVLATIRR